MPEAEIEKKPSTGRLLRLVALTGWTLFVAAIWLMMIVSLGSQHPAPGQTLEVHNQAMGFAVIMVSGCAGGGWFCGLLVLILVAAVLR